jgi:DNA-binding CsgD family transcriptional regulator
MPVKPLYPLPPHPGHTGRDLRSVPRHRYFRFHPIVDRMRKAVPFDHISISGLDLDGYHFGRGLSVDTDLPPAFVEAYDRERLYEIDPFVHAAKAGHVVVEAEIFTRMDPPAALVEVMRAFNIRNRTLIPVARGDIVYGAAIFMRERPFDKEEIAFLTLVASAIHGAVTRPLMERFAIEHLRLSRGEVACLLEASHGLTSEAIARATGYQNDTVNSYIKSAMKKLGASNRTQAIADAIRRNIIH